MSGHLLGLVWGAVSIETPAGVKAIDYGEKVILARFADSANDEGIVSHLAWPRLERECCISRRELARIMARFRTCPKSEKYRTEECGEPGAVCLHHWGVLEMIGLFTSRGIRCRRYRLRADRLLDGAGNPRRCPTDTFEGVQQAPLKVSNRHPFPPIQEVQGKSPANLDHSDNSVSSSSSSLNGGKTRGWRVEVPKTLLDALVGKKLNQWGEEYSPGAVARLWAAVMARSPGATVDEVVDAVNRCVKSAYFTRYKVRSWVSFLYRAVPDSFGVAPGEGAAPRRRRRAHNAK